MLPAGRAFSLDALLRPATRLDTVPLFTVAALRLQIGVVVCVRWLAKLNSDWLFEAQPLQIRSRRSATTSSWWAFFLREPLVAHLASLSGGLFDLADVPALDLRRHGLLPSGPVSDFHPSTALSVPIGFLFIMVVSTTLFFSPYWPRRFVFLGRHVPRSSPPHAASLPRWLPAVLVTHGCIQLILPLRAVGRATESAWTTRGFNFGWNVMIAEKVGAVTLEARDRVTGECFPIDNRRYLTKLQERAMAQDPEMVRSFALYVANDIRTNQGRDVEIRADAFASLNGRPAARLIDERVDLTRERTASIALPLE